MGVVEDALDTWQAKVEAAAAVPSLLKRSEAAALFNVSTHTIYEWERAGKLDSVRLGHTTVRVTRQSVLRLMEQSRRVTKR